MAGQTTPPDDHPSPKRQKLFIGVLVGGLVALTLGAAVTFNWPMAPLAGANPDDPAQVAMGQAVYKQYCASCHGANLEGQPKWRVRKADGKLPAPPHNEQGHTSHHPDEHLFRLTKNGVKPPLAPLGYKSDMPAFDGVLSDEEIWAVLAFIKNSWPPKERSRQNRMNEAYKK